MGGREWRLVGWLDFTEPNEVCYILQGIRKQRVIEIKYCSAVKFRNSSRTRVSRENVDVENIICTNPGVEDLPKALHNNC